MDPKADNGLNIGRPVAFTQATPQGLHAYSLDRPARRLHGRIADPTDPSAEDSGMPPDGPAPAETDETPVPTCLAAGDYDRTVTVAGVEHTYQLHVPPGLSDGISR